MAASAEATHERRRAAGSRNRGGTPMSTASGMVRQVSVEKFFTDNESRLGLSWLAGRQGGNRVLTGDAALKPTIGQVGHMNFIHPFRIQILGAAELAWLRGLSVDALTESIDRLFTTELVAIVVANDEEVLPYVTTKCESNHVALFSSAQPSPHLVEVIRLYLSRVLAESTTLHGVFLDVLEMGVLITGASAIGKSELALELISRGNGLVADDIVEIHRISPDTLEGRCPGVLRDFLEVRGIGILNIRTIFGETAVRPRKLLKLMVHLEDHSNEAFSELDRLQVNATYQEILDVPVRKVTIPVAAGRNLAVLVEAAVRNFVLNQRGIDSTKEFIERQQRLMEDGD
jgi:HPr kinase/phosphorylase